MKNEYFWLDMLLLKRMTFQDQPLDNEHTLVKNQFCGKYSDSKGCMYPSNSIDVQATSLQREEERLKPAVVIAANSLPTPAVRGGTPHLSREKTSKIGRRGKPQIAACCKLYRK